MTHLKGKGPALTTDPAGNDDQYLALLPLNVTEWDMTSPSDGLTTVDHSLEPIGLPTPFGFPHLKDNVEPTTVNPA